MCDAVELTRELVQIESTNPGMGEGEIEAFVRQYLSDLDIDLAVDEVLPGRCNVAATIPVSCGNELSGSLPGNPGPMLVLACHMDTVVAGKDWTRDSFGGELKDGRIYGRGACDMKAGLACALSVFRKTAEAAAQGTLRLRRPLRLLCTVDEEADMRGIEHAIESGLVGEHDWVLDLEPTDGEIQMAHKGRFWVKVNVHGITAHASKPEQGADAVAAAAELITRVREAFGQLPVHDEMGPSTVTFGQILGGYQPYVVPDECELWMDFRLSPPTDDKEVLKIVEEAADEAKKMVPGITVDYRVTGNRPYIEKNEASELLEVLKKSVKKVTGEECKVRVFPGYTDTAVIAGKLGNRECMSYGPGSLRYAHKPDEFVETADIRRCEAVLGALVEELCRCLGIDADLGVD